MRTANDEKASYFYERRAELALWTAYCVFEDNKSVGWKVIHYEIEIEKGAANAIQIARRCSFQSMGTFTKLELNWLCGERTVVLCTINL
ncbi:hypothetical protein CDAR_279371 [Caerostris darwini]|uniref:Uncharacterized protein n=1 Tax=Caerostris darwini TaxID=1538125 RepID=A0AAV4VMZ9_9ARAC|nr:hypothetical protein CDAR_279371 [Caerostris darwini]